MRRLIALALVLIHALAAPRPASALDTRTRAVGPVVAWDSGRLAHCDPAWLHVKYVEGSDVVLADGRFLDGHGRDLAGVNAALAGARMVRRTFAGDRATLREWKLRGESACGRTGPDLSLWYDVELSADRTGLATAINALNALAAVEIAHPAPSCGPAVITGSRTAPDPVADRRMTTPGFVGQQSYLFTPPVGFDAPAAWAHAGGRGAGTRFIDVEANWVWGHEDFNAANRFYTGGDTNPDEYAANHGTAVLGQVVGVNNGFGITGFAAEAEWGTVGVTLNGFPDVPADFMEAIENLRPGDVWLIELQMNGPVSGFLPMEYVQVNFDAIWTGCWSLGVVCVEAGGNGSLDLDAPEWEGLFDRDVRDSGAIMVAAGTPSGRVAESFTNWGSRMDLHGWGSSITTCGYGDLYDGGSPETWYTEIFGGTSGASPMIAGSALCIQGILRAATGHALAPEDLRSLLRDTGTQHLDPDQEIGPRPDLGAAVAMLDLTAVSDSTPGAGLAVVSAVSPFDGETAIRFRQPRAGTVRVDIYDLAGRRVRALALPAAAAGTREVRWDGRDAAGAPLGSGVYLYSLRVGGEVVAGRVVKVR